MNHLNPSREQFKALYALRADEPILMLNLLRFRDEAAYGEASLDASPISGRAAYERYSALAQAAFHKVGGRQLWLGRPAASVIGPVEECWDFAFVALYPSVLAFIEMVKSPAYQEAALHRTAALLDSRLVGCWELSAGASFAPLSWDAPP